METILKPFPYQNVGISWLKKKRIALLGDEMGLGKSLQVVKAADELNLKRIIIVCPSIARLTWEREIRKWSSLPNRKVRILRKRNELPKPEDEVLICSFDYVTHRFRDLGHRRSDLLVVDESHYLKSLEAKRSQAVLAKGGVAHAADRIWFVTGTPMPNHPGELWAMLYTFGVTRYNYDAFVVKYCEYYDFNGRKAITGTKRSQMPEIREMLASIMLRRLTREVLKDLPDARISELPVEADLDDLTPELKAQFEELSKFVGDFSPNMSAMDKLSALESVAQSIATLRRYCAMAKVKPICDLVAEELENKSYAKIIIFGIHREAIEEITRRLSGHGAVSIHGGIGANQRQENIDRFQNQPLCRVFVGNIQAAGTNITLTAASEVLFVEQAWVPGDNAQAIARALRIGQKNFVNVRIALLANSVDEKVSQILTSKLRDLLELLG